MLAALLNTPRTPEDWKWFSFHHAQDHMEIAQAINAKQGTNLQNYIIDPISPAALDLFLENNQQYHVDMNNALGLPSVDLEETDLTNAKQLQAWIWLNYLEHQSARETLGI